MSRTPRRADAEAIWRAAVDAVRGARLMREQVRLEGRRLHVADEAIDLDELDRLVVVGAGKAVAGMAEELEAIVGPALGADRLSGWLNVPANQLRPLRHIRLHPARPAACNEPTAEGVAGAEAMLEMVAKLGPRDVVICLLTGGASALLPLPIPQITLADKLAVTRHLTSAGADIRQLNTVRKHLSQIKGGGLARACRSGRLLTLAISDVIGDPVDVIGSGPTVPDPSTAADALAVLEQFEAREAGISPAVFQVLREAVHRPPEPIRARCSYHILGNLSRAVTAGAVEAQRRGYHVRSEVADAGEGTAEEVGRRFAHEALRMRATGRPECLVSGGEPVVRLVPEAQRGLGGRNQQLVLAALEELWSEGAARMALLSGGTDGEDGPTDAAGAVFDEEIIATAKAGGLDPRDYLRRNDAYRFFEVAGGHLMTGPTDTNVCDMRVVLSQPET